MKNTKEYKEALDKAHKEAGDNAYFGNGFDKGYDFAMSQPKHIFDGAAQVGEVRRFKDDLVDVVDDGNNCTCCVLDDTMPICDHLTNCKVNNVKYIKRE